MKKYALFALVLVMASFSQAREIVNGDGPTWGVFKIDGSQRQLVINYNGYLASCDSNKEITAVITVRQDTPPAVFYKVPMSSNCDGGEGIATLFLDPSIDAGLWHAIVQRQLTSFAHIELKLAFMADGQWDSNFSQNWVLQFSP